MAMHEKKKKGLVLDYCNGVELPMIDKDILSDGAGAAGVRIGNIASNPYLGNIPYRELANDDDDNNTADDTYVEIVSNQRQLPRQSLTLTSKVQE